MNNEDKKEFSKILGSVFEAYGRKPPTRDAMQIWWSVFDGHDMDVVRNAFSLAVRESTEFLVPAAVAKFLPDISGFMPPEEAWAHIPRGGFDAGRYVTEQMMAAYGTASDDLRDGNLVGAKISFIASYKRIVQEAKVKGEKPKWFFSASGVCYEDQQQEKLSATKRALEAGWITESYALPLMEQLVDQQEQPDPRMVEFIQSKFKLIGNGSQETSKESSQSLEELG